MQTVSFRVLKIRDLRSDFTHGYSHGRVCIYASIFDQENKVSSPELLHCYKSEEVQWSNADALLEWSRSHEEFQEIKASQPRIKFHVAMESINGEVSDIGFFIMDIRNIFAKENVEEVKIMNMHPSGAHVTIGSKLADHKTTMRSSNEDILRASIESNSSILVIPPHYDLSRGVTGRYCISVTLKEFRNIAALNLPVTDGGFWFCWSVLDMTLQSAVYGLGDNRIRADGDIPPIEDRVFVECSETALRNLLFEIGVLRIFLCCPGTILRVAEVPLFPADSPSSKSEFFPLQVSGWSTLSSLHGGSESDEDALPSLFTVVEVRKSPNERSESSPPPPQTAQTHDEPEADEEENYYDEEEFEDQDPCSRTAEDADEPNPQTMLRGTLENSHSPALSGPQGSAKAQSGLRHSLDEGESVYDNKHYRLCINIKQLRDLDRAAHVSVQFAYPYLGINSSPVRTNGTWTSAHSECLIEGAVASFDFGMIPSQLQSVLGEKKLVIQVLSRSQLGVDILGDATVDMGSLFSSRTSHVFRCPLTGKQFQRLEHFARHRHMMIALFSLGRVSQVPPHNPVVIRNIDMFVPILSPGEKGGVVERGKLRVVLILEDMGLTTGGAASRFKARRGEDALLHMKTYEEGAPTPVTAGRDARGRVSRGAASPPPPPTKGTDGGRGELISSGEEEDIMRRLEWEEWRRGAEEKWMAALREKEMRLKQKLEEESAANLSERADDLKRAQEEVGRLEVRLRSSIDTVERQKAQLELKEEQMNIRLAQKTDELQLLQRKIREEAKAKIDVETRRSNGLEQEVTVLQESLARMEKRAKEAEKDYETYRQHVRAMPETSLREETSRLKAQVAELRGEVERERRLRAEIEMEKEHYRSQMHRIAVALKREREKSAAVARQDLEQLRLEFLAREERYMLDGDRDELRAIRDELAFLRSEGSREQDIARPHKPASRVTMGHSSGSQKRESTRVFTGRSASQFSSGSVESAGIAESSSEKIARLLALKTELMESQLYDPSDSVIQEIDNCIVQEQVIIAEMRPYSRGTPEVK